MQKNCVQKCLFLRPGAVAQSPGREAALAWASLAQRSPASSVLPREGAGCGSVGDTNHNPNQNFSGLWLRFPAERRACQAVPGGHPPGMLSYGHEQLESRPVADIREDICMSGPSVPMAPTSFSIMLVPRGDRDLGVAFQAPPGSQASCVI